MTIDATLLTSPHKVGAACRSATLSVDLMAVRPAPKVSAQLLHRSRITAALLAFSLAAGVIVHPTASLDVQLLTPAIIGLSELEEIYNYTDALGRYIITADGKVFEVKEASHE